MREVVRRAHPDLPGRARFVAVSFEPPAALRAMRDDLHADLFALCSDPGRQAYRAFGLRRGRPWEILGRRTIAAYVRALARGARPRRPAADLYELGGDFVLDAAGFVRFVYASREPADRPDAAVLVGELARWTVPA